MSAAAVLFVLTMVVAVGLAAVLYAVMLLVGFVPFLVAYLGVRDWFEDDVVAVEDGLAELGLRP